MTTTDNISNLSPEDKRKLLAQLIREKQSRPETHPQSASQQRLWLLDNLEPGKPTFNMPAMFSLKGRLDPRALEDAINQLVARHASLRTTFTSVEGHPVQIVRPELTIELPVQILDDAAPNRVQAVAEAFFRQPFDLQSGPLIRVRLLRIRVDEHILLVTLHHIISDGWSMGIFYKELAELYTAALEGRSPNLPELTTLYHEYARDQNARLSTNWKEEELAFWKKRLAGAPMNLELPTDRPRPAVQSYAGAQFTARISSDLKKQIRSLAANSGATLFMTLLAAWYVLLSKYSGQHDILVGTPIAGRTGLELENLIGFFLNTLLLRGNLEGNPDFRTLIHQVQETTINAYDHQELPIEVLIEHLNPPRDLSKNPIFQVLFSLQNMPQAAFNLPDLTITRLPASTLTSKLDLSLYVTETSEGLDLLFEYSTDLFDRATIERMAAHFEHLLDQLTAHPDRPLSEISLLTAQEETRLAAWNNTATPYPEDDTIPALFLRQLEKTPDAVAFSHNGQTITYAQLAGRAASIQADLLARGLRPGDVVAVSLPRSFDMVAALLAILASGAAYLPLDPAYPADRLAFMLADAGASVLITTAALAQGLPRHPNTLTLEWANGRMVRPLAHSPIRPSAPAYIIYTSGSTGRPKGVVVPHRQIANRLHWMWQAYPFQPGEVGCQRTALSFVDSIWEIFGYLLQGVPTAILDDDTVKDPHAFVDALAQYRISRLWLVPSLLRTLLDEIPDLASRLPHLRFWVTTGETIPRELFERFSALFPDAQLFNLYGTSEVWDATWWVPDNDFPSFNVPIGRPLPNVTAYILDDALNPLPPGIPGTLFIGGHNLAHGYLNRPALTAERFIPDPFGPPGARLYNTGDLARFLPSGDIEFIGRRDFQVKVRGHRVELGEIEAVLLELPEIAAAAVALKNDLLAAYFVPEPGAGIDPLSLRNRLKQRLPDPMIPASFTPLEALPLTPSGKIDRRSLPDPDRPDTASDYAAPLTETEDRLADLFAEVLDLDRVGRRHSFFDLGGHSLLAIQLFSRIEEIFEVRLPLAVLFQSPTVAELAEVIEGKQPTPSSILVPIQPAGNQKPFFCVHGFGGGVVGYAELARHLGADQPFYGLQAEGMEGDTAPDTDLKVMARRYIDAMRQEQPEGPYRIGGYCYGGVVAFEMARQLLEVGQETELVAIFEGYAPLRTDERETVWQNPRLVKHFLQNVVYWWRDFFRLGAVDMRARAMHTFRRLQARFLRRLGMQQDIDLRNIIEDDVDLVPEMHRRLMQIHIRALIDYTPGFYPGRVDLFRVRGGSLSTSPDPEYGWRRLAGSVRVHTVEGAHNNILQVPYVRSLAEQVKKTLDER